ncbi:MAG: TolC family outer membrane protein [Sinimarinibacterium flocculans]|uniref:TolC family outer membrane protein n=1 Tax=Sinimarinibacterium flocculans TaxID=985250 RepID=UPI003518E143
MRVQPNARRRRPGIAAWRRVFAPLAGGVLALAANQPALAQGSTATDLLAVCNDALQGNAGYRAARAELLATRELLPQAKGKLLPQLGVRAQYDWLHERITGDYYGVIDIDRDDDFDQLLYGARLTQALYQPGLMLGKTQASLRVEQAEYKLRGAQDALLLEVAETYFVVLAAEDALLFARAETLALREQLDQVRAREASGLATDADLKAAQAQYEIAVAGETEALDAVANATTRLEALGGRRYERLWRLPLNLLLVPPQPADVEVWTGRAEAGNTLIRMQELGVDIAELGVERARKAQWPTVDIVGDAFSLDSGGGLAGERDEDQERIGVVLTLPLYTGGQIESAKRQTLHLQTQAEALRDDVRTQVLRDTRIAYRNSSAGLQRVNALKRALDAAVASEQSTRAGFEAGTLSNADLLTAVERRYAAERDHANARYRFLINSLRLKSLAGNLLVADLAQINRMLEAPKLP